jgi:hypothetical protein
MARPREFKLGSTSDAARFTRERARALSPEEGLSILEDLRSMAYDDPEAPPRLERVFVLSEPKSRALRGARRARTRDVR